MFCKLDLVKGYHQVPMAADSVSKTAVTMPFGSFEYLFMPFGLRNAAQTFQRLMDTIFSDMDNLVSYLDDHLVAGYGVDDTLATLKMMFGHLAENGLTINPDKFVFMVPEVDFLGHRLNADGLTPLDSHVAAVRDFPRPPDLKGLQRFLGMLNFYRRFMPGLARTVAPLTDATKGKPKGNLKWSAAMANAFEAAKEALINAVPLHHPDPEARISLATDASDTHIGAVLQQWSNGAWRPISFFSRKLANPELKYSAFDRELLAAYAAIRHFRFMVEGRPFTLFTDHLPLVTAISRVSPPWTAKQQ
jgi:hypothetical protein